MTKRSLILLFFLFFFFTPERVSASPFGCTFNPNSCGPGECCSSHLAGTKIKTIRSSALDGYTDILIENLKVGDRVLGYDVVTGKYVVNTITAFHTSIRSDGIYVVKTDSHTLSATSNHPFYVGRNKFDAKVDENGYKKVSDLKLKEDLFVLAKDKVKGEEILGMERRPGDHQVFTLTTSGTNNYFANEILVHNKFCESFSCGGACTPDTNWSNCSVPCGGGIQYDDCGTSRSCNTQSCCTPSWGACSVSCGGGTQSDGCGGTRSCNTQACCTAVDGGWGNWGACSVTCGGGTRSRSCNSPSPSCGGASCTGSSTDICNTQACCVPASPVAPVLISPASGTQARVGVATTLDWNGTSDWGTACTGANNHYTVCISGNGSSCDLVNNASTGLTTQYSWTPATANPSVTWHATADNGPLATNSLTRNLCVEGFDANSTTYVSDWGSCNAGTHTRSRTCSENCGSDDCASVSLAEDCQGSVRGTLFDASEISSCPGFDPSTGYLTGLPSGTGIANRGFGFSGPWAPLTAANTNGSGNYNISVYAPGTYSYDFNPLSDLYSVGGGPKLICTSAVATVPDNLGSCNTQPCSTVNNMSFGFWRIFGGWWQAKGASVYAAGGVKSVIPGSVATEQSLILPDTSPAGRVGFLSYGVTRPANMLGSNPSAQVSTPLWEKQSKYEGLTYDWNFYNKRFKSFTVTNWDGATVNYDDAGNGYQIFKINSSVSNFNFAPTGTQKMIFLVNGNVQVSGNLIVPSGAFMSIIASGDITFDVSVTQADGWFVADKINVPCKDIDGTAGCDKTDSQFVGNGTFVGWSGIDLRRDRGLTNNVASAEMFVYRRDLYTNAPEPMKVYPKTYKPFVP